MNVLLRDFEKLDLPEHTHRFWSIVVEMMREERGLEASPIPGNERGITYRTRHRFHHGSDRSPSIVERSGYRYGDLPEVFWIFRGMRWWTGAIPASLHGCWKTLLPALSGDSCQKTCSWRHSKR